MYFEVFCILCILCILIYMCITFVYFSLLVSASQSLRTRARGWGVGTVSLEGIYVKWAWLLVLSGRHFTVNSDLVKNKRLGHQNRLVLRLSGLLGPPDLKSNMAYVHLLRIPSVRRCGRLCGPQTCAAALSWLVSSWPDWAATGLLQRLLWPRGSHVAPCSGCRGSAHPVLPSVQNVSLSFVALQWCSGGSCQPSYAIVSCWAVSFFPITLASPCIK